ncbi:glycosyltransferase [Pelagicoccus albus]|uniref:Glycosyltransferase n=1 Tax=Pelagicoccus albus TaxID=415222 RepID=A0A7X1B5Z3_9BACT|nr:glycosyltransferase [Pelagicoccus albus]MBC2606269.1 glycosyltransferase [Pelagicoccus albus]
MADQSDIALAHHWLTGIRGGEKVLEQFCRIYPDSEISTLVNDIDDSPDWLEKRRIRTSMLQVIPRARKLFKAMLPLFPFAIGLTLKTRKDVSLVLSTDASLIKGLRTPKDAIHVCYCHSPPRYLWDMQDTYLQQSSELGFFSRCIFKLITPYLKAFDRRASLRVTHFVANSKFVAERIRRCYGRESKVIYPPVSFDEFRYEDDKDDFYLVVSELVPYKRIDIAVEAFNRSGKKLVVIGDGSERARLQAMAKENVTFMGRQPFSSLVDHYARAKAFIFPGIEDFGITPLEAQASGTPVVAFGKGGALETVIDGKTGTFFHEQTSESLRQAVQDFEASDSIQAEDCRANAALFGEERFREEIASFVRLCYAEECKPYLCSNVFQEYSLAL